MQTTFNFYLSLALSGPKDSILVEELALADRRQKREIKQLEEENERWKVRPGYSSHTQC